MNDKVRGSWQRRHWCRPCGNEKGGTAGPAEQEKKVQDANSRQSACRGIERLEEVKIGHTETGLACLREQGGTRHDAPFVS